MQEIIVTPPTELFEYFKKRTQRHKVLVRRNTFRYIGTDWSVALDKRCATHDDSKFKMPEAPGFVWLTTYYWLQLKDPSIEYTKDTAKQIDYVIEYMRSTGVSIVPDGFRHQLELQFNAAFEYHYKRNRHHPEYHDNIEDMTEIDLIEMVCDWTAMSQELKQDNGSAKGWADKAIAKRFKFSKKQIDFIYEQIAFLDEQNKHPMFVCKRGVK